MPMLAYSAGLLRAEDEQLGDAFEGRMRVKICRLQLQNVPLHRYVMQIATLRAGACCCRTSQCDADYPVHCCGLQLCMLMLAYSSNSIYERWGDVFEGRMRMKTKGS
jgi:hypothetical protein